MQPPTLALTSANQPSMSGSRATRIPSCERFDPRIGEPPFHLAVCEFAAFHASR